MPHLQQGAYSFEELSCELRTVVGKDETQRAVDVNSVVQERVCDDRSGIGPKRDDALQLREPVGYYQHVLITVYRLR